MPWSMREDAYDRPLPRLRPHDAAAIRDGYLNRFPLKSPDVRESGAAPAPGLSRRPRPAQAAQPVVVRPAEYHPGVAAGPGDLRERTYHFFAVPDSPASGAHEPPGDALRLSPWPAWEPLSEPDDDVRLFGASAYACAYRFVTSTLAFIDNFSSSSTPHRGQHHPLTRGKSVRHSTLLRGDYV